MRIWKKKNSPAVTAAPVFDHQSRYDPRSLDYKLDNYTSGARRSKVHKYKGQVLDQGYEGACVGFAFAHWLGCETTVRPTEITARTIYHGARLYDEWEGEGYEGTSVLGGAKILKAFGYISSYYWATSADETVRGISALGPVVLGIPWYESMNDVKKLTERTGGFIVLKDNDKYLGNHAILANAIRYKDGNTRLKEAEIHLLNSWGTGWGHNGGAWIKLTTLNRLIQENGEACLPIST